MTNNGSNTPGNGAPENRENTQKWKTSSKKIIEEGIKKAYYKNGVFDPYELNQLDWAKISDEVKNGASLLLQNDEDIFSGISEDDIRDLSPEAIRSELRRMILPLLSARKIVATRLRKQFQNVDEKITEKKKGRVTLDWVLKSLDENQLWKIIDGRKNMFDFLRSNFWLQKDDLMEKKYELEKIFEYTDLKEKDAQLYAEIQELSRRVKLGIGGFPTNDTIRWILLYFEGNQDVISRFCEELDLTFSVQEAEKYGLIDEDIIEKTAQDIFTPGAWNTLTSEEKTQATEQVLRSDWKYSYKELQTYGKPLIINDASREALVQHIQYDLSKNIDDTREGRPGELIDFEVDPEGNMHSGFLKKLKQANPSIENIDDFIAGSTLEYDDPKNPGRKAYIFLESTDQKVQDPWIINGTVPWVVLKNQTGPKWTLGAIKNTANNEISYEDLIPLLGGISWGKIYTKENLNANLKNAENPNGNITDQRLEETPTTIEFLQEQLDLIDPEGKGKKIEVGLSFRAKNCGEDGIAIQDTYYTIKKLNPPSLTISTGETVDFLDFLEAARNQGFRRIGRINTPDELLHELEKYGVDSHHTSLSKDGDLIVKNDHHDDHGDHGGHDKKEKKYEYFVWENNAHIRMMGINPDGTVLIGEWSDKNTDTVEDIQQKTIKGGKLTEKSRKSFYQLRTLTYAEFVDYLKENKLKATTEDLLDKHASYHGHGMHQEHSMFKKYMTNWSIADMIKGVKGIAHGVEHYLEKWSKLNASRFALKMGNKLGLPADIMAQLQADEVGSIKEIITKIQEKIGSQNGPKARNKALHIAHSSYSRPEEVAAAMLYMMNSYGSLYAEDIAYAQGSESFVNGFLYSLWFRGSDIDIMKRKWVAKAIPELGNEPWAKVTEEAMIYGILKTLDGNFDEYPQAATIAKAMGGPSAWEKAWQTEGFKNAKEKGTRQASSLVNVRGRVNKGISALGGHEYHTFMGVAETVPAKNPAPEHQDLAVIWALTGYSQYLSTVAQQDIVKMAYGNGHSFSAYSFLRNKTDNDLYRDVFLDALHDTAPGDVGKLKDDIAFLQYTGHENDDKRVSQWKRTDALKRMSALWQEHSGALHEKLQGKNTWLIEQVQIHKNEKAKKYLETLSWIHSFMGKEQAPGSEPGGWSDQFWYTSSPIITYTEDGYQSLERMVNKVKMSGSTNFSMDGDLALRFWKPSIQSFDTLKSSSLPSETKRKQYDQYRLDVLIQLRKMLNSKWIGQNRADAIKWVKSNPYYKDIEKIGLSVDQIFEENYEESSDKDYQKWISGNNHSTSYATEFAEKEKVTISELLTGKPPANDNSYPQQ